jgi:hypothetical protein
MTQGATPGGPPDPGRLRNAKLLRGCGGCGCAFALLLGIGAVVLVAFGMQEATKEALPFGFILSGFAGPIAIIGLVLLLIGISKVKKLS